MKKNFGMAAALMTGIALVAAVGPAQARTSVNISIGVPGPVYTQPVQVYRQPVRARPVHVEQRRDWRGRARYGWRDQDRDRVPNRIDRDRDGDGVPNRHDYRPNNPYRY